MKPKAMQSNISPKTPKDLTIIILTKNESIHMHRLMKNLSGLAKNIFIVDSFSSDDTVAIAESYGAIVLQNNFINQAKQFQWAQDNIKIETKWVMRLDADEIIEPDLRAEIEEKLDKLPEDVVGINLKRKHIFMGHWVRFGGRYPVVLLRIWRNGHGYIEDRWMDEHILVERGRTITLKGGFADYNLNNITFFTAKHNSYATREAIDVLTQRLNLRIQNATSNTRRAPFQAAIKRSIKEYIYNRIPFTVSTLMYFVWRYIFQLGFLDGRYGLVYHFLQGYWYRFLVGAKILEIEQSIQGLQNPKEIKEKIYSLTGYNLE